MRTDTACLNCGHIFSLSISIRAPKARDSREDKEAELSWDGVNTRDILDLSKLDDHSLDKIDKLIDSEKLKRLAELNISWSDKAPEALQSLHRSGIFECEICKYKMHMIFSFQFLTAVPADASSYDDNPVASISPKKLKEKDPVQKSEIDIFIEKCKKEGVINAFERALISHCTFSIHSNRGKYKSIERFFIYFIKGLSPYKVPTGIIERMMPDQKRPDGILLYTNEGVFVATNEEHQIISFFPKHFVIQMKKVTKDGLPQIASPLFKDTMSWIRTRNGYVPSNCKIFLDELRAQSVGVRSGSQ